MSLRGLGLAKVANRPEVCTRPETAGRRGVGSATRSTSTAKDRARCWARLSLSILINPNLIAAGGESKGLFQSEDCGESWQRVDVEGPLKCEAQRISSLQYNKSLDGHLTVGTFPDAEFEAAGLGDPGCENPGAEGRRDILGWRKDRFAGEYKPYPGFGFSAVHLNHPRRISRSKAFS